MPKNTAPKSVSSSSATLQVTITEFKSFEKGMLKGFATVEIHPPGLRLKKCGYFIHSDGSGKRWFNWPSESYMKDGKREYFRLVEAADSSSHSKLQSAALDAIDRYFEADSSGSASAKETLY